MVLVNSLSRVKILSRTKGEIAMSRRILVATDGSSHSDRAVDLAAELTIKLDGQLSIVHVLIQDRPDEQWVRLAESERLVRQATRTSGKIEYVPGQLADFFDRHRSTQQQLQLIAAMGDLIVERAAKRAKALGVAKPEIKVLNGDCTSRILDEAKAVQADMLVMGRRGLGPLKKLVQGSVSRKINDHAHCAVVTVP